MPSDIRVSGYAGSVDSTSSVGGMSRGNDSPGGFDSLLRLPPQLSQQSNSPPPPRDDGSRRPLQSVADRPAYAESAQPRSTDARDDQAQDGGQTSTTANANVGAQARADNQAKAEAAKDGKADEDDTVAAVDDTPADDAAALAAAGAAGVQVAPIVADEVASDDAVPEELGIEPIAAAIGGDPAALEGDAVTVEAAGAATVATGSAAEVAAASTDVPAKEFAALVEPVQQVESVNDAPNGADAAILATVDDDAALESSGTQLESAAAKEQSATAATVDVAAATMAGASTAASTQATETKQIASSTTTPDVDEPVDATHSPAQPEPSGASANETSRLAGADEKQNSDGEKQQRDEQAADDPVSGSSTTAAPASFEAAPNVDNSAAASEVVAHPPTTDSGANAQPTRADSAALPTIPLNPIDAGVRQSAPVRLAAELLGGSTRTSSDAPPVEINSTRFLHRVASAFVAAEQRGGEVRLRLSPSELGAISVEVKLHDGALTARVETETAAAKTAVIEHLSQLRDRLAEQGVRIERFDVDVMQQGSTGTPNGPGQQQDDLPRQAPRTPRAPVSAASPAESRRPAAWGGNGSLNVIV